MEKVSLLLFYKDKEQKLKEVQELGLVHLDVKEEGFDVDYEKLQKTKERYEKILTRLNSLPVPQTPQARDLHVQFTDPAAELTYLEELVDGLDATEAALLELERDEELLEPWGDFSWGNIDRLNGANLEVHFRIASQQVFVDFDFQELAVETIGTTGGNVYFLVFNHKKDKLPPMPFERAKLPRRSLSQVRHEIEYLTNKHKKDLDRFAGFKAGDLEWQIRRLTDRLALAQAGHSLKQNESGWVQYIEGWIPKTKSAGFRSYLGEKEISYTVRKPGLGDDVPVLLKNKKPNRFFEAITKIFSLPSYFELDPTPFFAPFFTIFFGLCIGDAGYGLVLAGLATAAAFKVSPAMRPVALMGVLLGLSAALSGLLLDTFFGETVLTTAGGNGFLAGGKELAVFASYNAQGRTVFPAMTLALMLGFIQILFGIMLQAVNSIRRGGPLFMLQPLAMMTITFGGAVWAVHRDFLGLGFNQDFTIGPLTIGAWLSAIPLAAGQWAVNGGLLVFFLFNSPGSNVLLRPLTGIWEFYRFVTGLLGDFLSYIRLFALGLASGLLGSAFNHIAFMLLPQAADGSPEFASPLIILSVIILILGHTLNIGLAILGAFVHSLRLTFVEFYKNIQFEGGGKPYKAFRLFNQEP